MSGQKRQHGQTDRRMEGWINGWMDGHKVLINKGWRTQHRHELQRGEDAAEATEGLICDETQKHNKQGLFLPNRGRDHKAGLGGEMPR